MLIWDLGMENKQLSRLPSDIFSKTNYFLSVSVTFKIRYRKKMKWNMDFENLGIK